MDGEYPILSDATVIIRTKSGFATCALRFADGKAFAVTHENYVKGTDLKVGEDLVELDKAELQPADPSIHGANYVYGKTIEDFPE